jgi:hypothetical protein
MRTTHTICWNIANSAAQLAGALLHISRDGPNNHWFVRAVWWGQVPMNSGLGPRRVQPKDGEEGTTEEAIKLFQHLKGQASLVGVRAQL